MKYVVVERQPTGYWLDPEPYLAVLPEIAPELPPGRRRSRRHRPTTTFSTRSA